MTTEPSQQKAFPASLPAWAETVRRKYLGGEASVFVLHGNVFDRILHQGAWHPLSDYLAQVLLWENKQSIIHYDPSAGVHYYKHPSAQLAEELSAEWNRSNDSGEVLKQLEREILSRDRAALIISYAGTVAPPGEDQFLAHSDRQAVIRLHRWSLSSALAEKDNVVFLLAETLTELNPRLISNPRVAAVRIPLPDLAQRQRVIEHSDADIPAATARQLAQLSSGLGARQIAQLLTPQRAAALDEEQRLALIQTLLGASPQAETRARKLAALTQGMSPEEIRQLLRPDHPEASADDDDYAAIMQLMHSRKREIIEKECAGLIEFVDARHGLEAVGGNEEIKAELNQIAQALKQGDRRRVPMGLLFVGPMGCGKTFVAKCFVKSSGLTAVTLKNFRSKWVGSTEANLEKVLGMVKALGPIILIIDEGDRSFGGASADNDGGTSSRVIARLKEFMSDTDNRGQVLFILMTNRPDKLDVDIKRAGRLDRKIPFFYADDPTAIAAVLKALFKRYLPQLPADWDSEGLALCERLVGYSNADLEAITLLAINLAAGRAGSTNQDDGGVDLATLHQAVDDYLPSRDERMLAYMEMLAVFEASRRSMLPTRYRDMPLAEFNQRLRQLKLELSL